MRAGNSAVTSHPTSNTLTAGRFMRGAYSASHGPEEIVSDMKNQERLAQQKGAVMWIEETLGRQLPYPDNFHRSLKDGIILCQVINHHRPGTIKLISTKDLPFCQMENISNFLKAARDLGLAGPDLFQTVDLYESKDLFQVSVTILTVARVLAGVSLPMGGFTSKTSKSIRRSDGDGGGIQLPENAVPDLPAKPPPRKSIGTIRKGSTIARNAGVNWNEPLPTIDGNETTSSGPLKDDSDQWHAPVAGSNRRPTSSPQRTTSAGLTAASLLKPPTTTPNLSHRNASNSASEELLANRADDAEDHTMSMPTPQSNVAENHHFDNQVQPSTISKSQTVETSRPAPPPFNSSTHRVPKTTPSSGPTPHIRPSTKETAQLHHPPAFKGSASSDSGSDELEFDDGTSLNSSATQIAQGSADAVLTKGIPKEVKGRGRSVSELDHSGSKPGSRAASREQVDVSLDGKVVAQYQLGNCIGKGQFGSVYRALNLETGQMVAIKRIRLEGLSDKDVEDLMNEVNLLKSLSHSSIVKYEGFVKADTCLNIILEFVENGSLLHTLKAFGNFPEKLVVSYTVQILEGLAYLHDKQVVHCDLKAANILTTKSGNVKLTDFGVSLNLQRVETKIGTVAGTPNWMAPEVILLEGASTASDIWSLGCTIIEFLTCRPPYSDLLAMTALFHIVEDECPPLPDTVSEHCRDFLRLCFKKDPKERPTALQLFDHPWIQKNWSGNKNMTVRHPTSTSRPPLIPFAFQSSNLATPLQGKSSEHRKERSDSNRSRTGPKVEVTASEISEKINVEERLDIEADGEAEPSLNGTTLFHHRFVKTSFGKTITCKICQLPCKKKAVMCEECGLISHKHCSPLSLPTCGQHLSSAAYSPTTSALLSPAFSTESRIATTATDAENSRGTTRSTKKKETTSSRKVSSNHSLKLSGEERFKETDSPSGSVASEISGVTSSSESKHGRLQRKSKQNEEECIIS